jgi:hypothetical protein
MHSRNGFRRMKTTLSQNQPNKNQVKTPNPQNIICLYGRKNPRIPPQGKRLYWTDWRPLLEDRRRVTGREPFRANVTSESTDPDFRALSPILMGPVECYRENGRMITAVSVEVAWQYSKVYSHIRQGNQLVDISNRFITRDAEGNLRPSQEWFHWRDAAFNNPAFNHTHPGFKSSKKRVRRAFPGGSKVAFWYWDGEILDAVQARQKIYARLYQQFVVNTPGFRRLRQIVSQGGDLFIYDRDGYDWQRLNMSPADCVRDPHSFGHGMVITFLLKGIEPDQLVRKDDPALGWTPYDNHHWEASKQTRMEAPAKKEFERLAAGILGLSPAEAAACWGTAHPPGRNAQVIRIHAGVRHRFARNGTPLGLKIFNLKDGKTMWPSLFKFHTTQREHLPGLPNSHVQQAFECGTFKDADGLERGYLIHEWIDGPTLEDKLKEGVSRDDALRILDDLFLEIIIPLWSQGSSWWDVRDSNYVFTHRRKLVMIDLDTLGGYAGEILGKPARYERRNKGTLKAMERYARLIRQMAQDFAPKGTRGQTGQRAQELIRKYLQPAFCAPYPLAAGWAKQARTAYQNFRAAYQQLLSAPAATSTGPSGSVKNSK